MNVLTIGATIFGFFGTICAVVFGYAAFHRNRKEAEEADGKESGTLLTEIGYIKSGIDDIKRKQERQDERNVEFITRLTAVEASAKQAHKRIDRIEGQEE